jgi:hypothetical protein
MTGEEFTAEYRRLAHAVQTGVAYAMERDDQVVAPKHLRTGLNAVMSDLGSIGRLLIAKGVITEDEYFAAILDGLREEVKRHEASVSALYGGANITLR